METQHAALLLQLMAQQQQLATLEKQISRRTVILKLPEQASLQGVKYNLHALMQRSGLSEELIQDKVNHYVPTLGYYLFVTMVAETAKGMVYKTLKSGFYWKPHGADSFKLKFEDHVTPTDRTLTQPFYAMLDLINCTGLFPVEEFALTKGICRSFIKRMMVLGLIYLRFCISQAPQDTGHSLILSHAQIQSHPEAFPVMVNAILINVLGDKELNS